MSELRGTGLRSRLRDSSWFAFGATTSALVLLASGGTAFLVQFGVDEGRDPLHRHRAVAPAVPTTSPIGSVTVDRVVGSYAPRPQLPRTAEDSLALDAVVGSVPDLPVTPPPTPPTPTDPPLVPTPPVPVTPPTAPPPPPLPAPVPTPPSLLPLPLPIPLPEPLHSLLPILG